MQVTESKRLVEGTRVLAPNFIVPGIKKDGKSVCLADFGEAPFQLVVPLTMLAPHIETRASFPAAALTAAALASAAAAAAAASSTADAAAAAGPSGAVASEDGGSEDGGAGRPPTDDEADAADSADEQGMQAGADSDYQTLSTADVERIRAATAAIAAATASVTAAVAAAATTASPLDPRPATVFDFFSCVLGDGFHYMDRPKVPMHHDCKKAYFVALRNAWFIFDSTKLGEVKAVLRQKGKSDEEIEAMMFYNFAYFRERVPRVVPPPSVHYPRVRAVFELFGPLCDAETGKPLFNEAAWKKAKGVLSEILAGNAADGSFSFYTQKLNSRGQPAVDADGLALFLCNRGTNDVENVHKQLVTTWGTWCVGIELTDCLLREWRHRFNQRVSERRRLGYPKIGHYDTWLIDKLQLLVPTPNSSSNPNPNPNPSPQP